MKLEQQVCSLELSKKLKELGVKQKSIWHWELHPKSKPELRYVENGIVLEVGDNYYISAFTVAELGEMLPLGCYSSVAKDFCIANYYCNEPEEENEVTADTEANARAKMLIYLIENKLMDAQGRKVSDGFR